MIETWMGDLFAMGKLPGPDGASTGTTGMGLGDLFALVALVINVIGFVMALRAVGPRRVARALWLLLIGGALLTLILLTKPIGFGTLVAFIVLVAGLGLVGMRAVR